MRSFILLLSLAACTGLVLADPPDTTLYKSVGQDGKIIYSDRPPISGPSKKMTFENLPASPLSPETVAYLEDLQKLGAAAMVTPVATSEVILFATGWCGYCKKARAYLAAKRVPYREVDIETKSGAAAYVQAGGRRGVPLLLAKGRRVAGFSVPAYDSLFKITQ
jgi:glutaredoxin